MNMDNFYISLKDVYEKNKKFKEYVDKYSKLKKISIDEALTHELVKQYYLSVSPGGINYEKEEE